MALSVEASARIELIRAKMVRGDATREEELEAFELLRKDREGAQIASSKARTEKAAASRPVDTAAILANITAQVFTKPAADAAPPAGSFKL